MLSKIFFVSIVACFLFTSSTAQLKIFVATNGNDKNAGTIAHPLKTPRQAIAKAGSSTNKMVIIELRGGVYDLNTTVEINSAFFTAKSLVIRGYKNEPVILSGSQSIAPRWLPYKNGIWKAFIDLREIPDQLFVNGKAMPMARYPNFDSTARNFNGTAADAISDERVKTWSNPAGGYIHALHNGEWGDFHYVITGKDSAGKLLYEGGWQNNRPAPMHKKHRFVENIFEELDAPGEWFYDVKTKTIYYYPFKQTDMTTARFAVSHLTDLIRVKGTAAKPVSNITLSNLRFSRSGRSFMLTMEPLLRSDWTIYRGAAVLFDGTENCSIINCVFDQLGGNAIFLSNYNKGDNVTNNHIYNIGGSAIAFVGSANAVRSPSFRYELFIPWKDMDFTPGPKTNEYPQFCKADGNLIHHIGTIEKQVAGVQIEMAAHITVSHNSIYTVPRSGINIGDGCWGGHILEFNDVFNTVLETGDHGAFNSWGRDRYWRPERPIIDSIVAAKPGIELLDVVDPIIIRNNRFQCEHGWDIDLDDGSSNYEIYNNVCLNGGLKLREGYHRKVSNNILVNNSFHPHVWLKNSGDVFMHNIVTTPYANIQMGSNWGDSIDANFFLLKEGLDKSQGMHLDKNSAWGDAQFTDAAKGNYQVSATSAAIAIGFKNFNTEVGVTLASLKKIAQRPPIKQLLTKVGETKGEQLEWLGAKLKNIESLGEQSAAGLHDSNGVLITALTEGSIAAKNQLRKGDVVVKLNHQETNNMADFFKIYQSSKWMGRSECVIIRDQQERILTISFNKE